jgi:hypothetical protein
MAKMAQTNPPADRIDTEGEMLILSPVMAQGSAFHAGF